MCIKFRDILILSQQTGEIPQPCPRSGGRAIQRGGRKERDLHSTGKHLTEDCWMEMITPETAQTSQQVKSCKTAQCDIFVAVSLVELNSGSILPTQNCHNRCFVGFFCLFIIKMFLICSGQGGECEQSGTEQGGQSSSWGLTALMASLVS